MQIVTHVSFIFERIVARWSNAMKMCCSLSIKSAIISGTIFGCSETLETFLHDCRIFPMVICMHLDIRRAYVDFVASRL